MSEGKPKRYRLTAKGEALRLALERGDSPWSLIEEEVGWECPKCGAFTKWYIKTCRKCGGPYPKRGSDD